MKLIYLSLLLSYSLTVYGNTVENIRESNKKLVTAFYQQVLLQGDASVIDQYIDVLSRSEGLC